MQGLASHPGRHLVAYSEASLGGEVKVASVLPELNVLQTLPSSAPDLPGCGVLAFDASGQFLITVDQRGAVSVWDWEEGRLAISAANPERWRCLSIMVHPSDWRRFSCGCDEGVVLWRIDTCKDLITISSR